MIPSIPDESIDGILFDTYPLDFKNEEDMECKFPFFDHAYRLLKKDGVFTYYSSEATDFPPKHFQLLTNAGFTNIQKKICPVNPPPDCLYWKSSTMIAPIVIK